MRSSKKGPYSALNSLAAGLAGLLTLELYFALQSFDYQPPPVNIAARAITGRIKDFGSPSQSVLSAQRAELLNRPLFNLSRRPPAASHANAMPEEIPRLSGIIITPNEKIAVFSPAKSSPIIIAKDGRLGAFTVLSITLNSVKVKGPNGVIVLRSIFSYQGPPRKSNPENAILPGGIDLSQINIPLPSAATWTGPPTAD